MNEKESYKTGNYSSQIKAMDANMHALERNLLHFTLWNYCSDNSNDYGDQWNGEDLSIFSRVKRKMSSFFESHSRLSMTNLDTVSSDEKRDSAQGSSLERISKSKTRGPRRLPSDLNLGGRALEAVVRPYAVATSGTPIFLSFDIKSGEMIFSFDSDPSVSAETEFFIPHLQYADVKQVQFLTSSATGSFRIDWKNQRCFYKAPDSVQTKHTIVFKRANQVEKAGCRLMTARELKMYHNETKSQACNIL